jgi:hypothetical protein
VTIRGAHIAVTGSDSDNTFSLSEIASLSRDQLVERLLHFEGDCPLDFTAAFLAQKSTDRLRHILIAAYKYGGKHSR